MRKDDCLTSPKPFLQGTRSECKCVMHLHFFSFEYFMLIFWYLSPSPDSSHPDSSLPFSFPQYFIVSVSPLPSPTSLSYECSLCWPITVVCVACLWVRGQPWIYQLSFPSKKTGFFSSCSSQGTKSARGGLPAYHLSSMMGFCML